MSAGLNCPGVNILPLNFTSHTYPSTGHRSLSEIRGSGRSEEIRTFKLLLFIFFFLKTNNFLNHEYNVLGFSI